MLSPTRARRGAAALISALALVGLAACGSSGSSSAADEPFRYTDDLGTKISLDHQPKRIIAQASMAAALEDLGVTSIGAFGPLKAADGSVDPQAAGLDVSKVTDVTGSGDYGNLDLEKVAGLKPDLVVTSVYLKPQLWYVNEATEKKLKKLVPLAVVSFDGKSETQLLDATERLATALGGDVDSAKVKKAHAEFAAASARLKKIGAELTAAHKKIVAGSPATDVLYVSNPKVSPDLKYFQSLGLPIVTPTKPDSGGYFEDLSWENADKYQADIFMYDARVGAAGLKIFDKQPVFQTLAAAKDKAYVPWQSVTPPSYQAAADTMNTLADDLEKYL